MPAERRQSSTGPAVIYVAGYGRSGSTVLDVILGGHPTTVSTGELGHLWRLYEQDVDRCSCGQTYRQCPFWSRVVGRILVDDSCDARRCARLGNRLEPWHRFLSVLLRGSRKTEKEEYCRLNTSLIRSIGLLSAKDTLIDSSKTAYYCTWRALVLWRVCGFPVRVIHLVRDVRAVMASAARGSNRKMRVGQDARRRLAVWRALLGWLTANSAAILIGILLPADAYRVLRYEDLLTDSARELDALGRFLGIDLRDVEQQIRNGRSFRVGHMVAGNRLIQKPEVTIKTTLEPTESLPLLHRAVCFLVALPIEWYVALSRRRRR